MNLRYLPALLVLAFATPASADAKAKARAHIERAESAHAEGKFEDALTELTLAYALDPDPQLLYAIGQIHVKLGHCAEAITFYERFLATKPSREEAAVVREAIATCKDAPPPPPPVEPPKEPVEPVIEPPKPIEPVRPMVVETTLPWYKDWIGDALVAGGVVSGIVGIVTYRSALDARDGADREGTYQDYEAALDEARGKRTLSIVFTVGGVALVGAGLLRYALADRTETRLVATPTRGGGVVTWNARF